MSNTKIIILDDDPTGSQTVHSCLLLTRWDVATLRAAILDEAPLFFVLTNTRGMDASRAAAITAEVCQNLKTALAELAAAGRKFDTLFVSRSDSTLRGHYPVETDVMAEVLGDRSAGFDAHFLIPAFFEGGRVTRDSTHYLMVDGVAVPTADTEFARDSVFGYSTSYLPDYVAEKTRGRIPADRVERFVLSDVRGNVLPRLLNLKDNACCVVDAEIQSDLDGFAAQLMEAVARGKRFLFRSAASLITALANLPPQPVPVARMSAYVRGGRPGAVVVGSHVKKSTAQLQRLLAEPGMVPVEIDVGRLPAARESLVEAACQVAREAHDAGLTPVIFTSRTERGFASQGERLAFGETVSGTLMDIVRGLPPTLGFLISKGGITSNDVLSTGLELAAARVVGQVLAGCSVVCCPDDHPRYPGMPVVIFPGNVGDDAALATVWRRLARPDLSPAEQLAA